MKRSANSPAQLIDILKGAKPGDIVELARGSYGAYRFDGLSFAAPGVTVQAAPGASVTFQAVTANRTSGLTLRNVEIAFSGPGAGIAARDAQRLRFSGLTIRQAAGGHNGTAVSFRGSRDCVVDGCRMRQVGLGVGHLECERLQILGNDFTDLRGDGVSGGASSHITVSRNTFSDFYPIEGDHPDAIQFWGLVEGKAPGHVIEDNVVRRGAGAPVQGIFIQNCKDIRVRGNALLGTMFNGISYGGVDGGLIEDNFVQGFPDMPTRIIVRSASTDVTVRGNVAQQVVKYEDKGPNPNLKMEGNKSIKPAKAGDVTALEQWLGRKKAAFLNGALPIAALAVGLAATPANRRSVLGQLLGAAAPWRPR